MWYNPTLELVGVFLASFFVTYFSIKFFINGAVERGFVSRDVHKKGRVFVAEHGGIPIEIGFSIGVLVFLMSFSADGVSIAPFLAGVISSLLVCIIGVVDDLFSVRWRYKIFFPIMASVPLIAVGAGDPVMFLPLIGAVNLGWVYYFVLIPLGITGASNAMNMIGGYNGSEAGLGILITATLLLISLHSGNVYSSVLLIAIIGALLKVLDILTLDDVINTLSKFFSGELLKMNSEAVVKAYQEAKVWG